MKFSWIAKAHALLYDVTLHSDHLSLCQYLVGLARTMEAWKVNQMDMVELPSCNPNIGGGL